MKRITRLLVLMLLSSCGFFKTNKGISEHFYIEYSDEDIDKEALDDYFSFNNEKYPSYSSLKENNPDLFDNVKSLKSSEKLYDEVKLLRFSYQENGFLDGETFLNFDNKFYRLGCAFGGYGVTEYIIRHGNAGYKLYFIYSYGSGIHRSEIGIFDFFKNEFLVIENLDLGMHKDYTFVIDEENNIDLYYASINPINDDNGFDTYLITKDEVAFEDIDNLKTKDLNEM